MLTRCGARRLRTAVVLLALAVGHLLLFLALFATAFGIEDGAGRAPGWLDASVTVLGSPLFTGLARVPPQAVAPLHRLLGGGNATLFLFAGVNSLVWAIAVRALWRAARRLARRPGLPAPAA